MPFPFHGQSFPRNRSDEAEFVPSAPGVLTVSFPAARPPEPVGRAARQGPCRGRAPSRAASWPRSRCGGRGWHSEGCAQRLVPGPRRWSALTAEGVTWAALPAGPRQRDWDTCRGTRGPAAHLPSSGDVKPSKCPVPLTNLSFIGKASDPEQNPPAMLGAPPLLSPWRGSRVLTGADGWQRGTITELTERPPQGKATVRPPFRTPAEHCFTLLFSRSTPAGEPGKDARPGTE